MTPKKERKLGLDGLTSDVGALAQVVLIDLALAADNAVAVGLAASALPTAQRQRAIAIGIGLALGLRVVFALITVQLLQIPGILLFGGLLLFWVAWRMWQDISSHQSLEAGLEAADAMAKPAAKPRSPPTFFGALLTIVVADVSMSLDNVLAVAGVARHAPEIMAFGLVLSVALMGVAAGFVAGVIARFRWIAVIGVIVIVFAGARMVWEDGHRLAPEIMPPMPTWLGAPPHADPVPPAGEAH
ncbi:MAG: YjbE family putative metal transport protein [Alphaproteobacteria bacterium]|nr:YjbE family putative metal transport protein [Alphaproteobacteria bacterium]